MFNLIKAGESVCRGCAVILSFAVVTTASSNTVQAWYNGRHGGLNTGCSLCLCAFVRDVPAPPSVTLLLAEVAGGHAGEFFNDFGEVSWIRNAATAAGLQCQQAGGAQHGQYES